MCLLIANIHFRDKTRVSFLFKSLKAAPRLIF